MGKGDKKSRRGKIILGSFGVRRPRKKTDKPEVKPAKTVVEAELKDTKSPREIKEVKEIKVTKEKAEAKEPKVAKEKKGS
jgi:30S ribosomal protein S31